MDRRIDAHIARTQFGQIMDLATKNNERFIVDRRGEPAVVIMSVQDFIRTAARLARESLERRQAAWARHLDVRRYRCRDHRAPTQTGPHTPRRGEVIRAVIDTNVLVSGLLSPAGNEALILLAIHQGLVHPCFSEEILEEYANSPEYQNAASSHSSFFVLFRYITIASKEGRAKRHQAPEIIIP